MPTGLETLLGMGGSSNRTPTRAYVPSALSQGIKRNNAKVGYLSHALGLGPEDDNGSISQDEMEAAYDEQVQAAAEQARQKAEADAYKSRVEGEYGLAGKRIEAETARANAEEAFNRAETQRQFTAQQNNATRDAIAQRQQYAQQQTNSRSQGIESGRNYRQQVAQANARAGQYEKGTLNAPVERSLSNFFGLIPGTQSAANQKYAQQLRQQAMSGAEVNTISDLAQQYREAYPSARPEELMAIIQQTQPDASEEEQTALFNEIVQQ